MGTWHDGYSMYEDDDGTYFATQDVEGPIGNDLGWLQPHTYGDSPVQQISNPGGVLAPALLATGAYFAGKENLIERGANAVINNPTYRKYYHDPLTTFLENKSNSVPMEGPMRFAGRGIPKVLYDWEIPGKDAPDDWVPALPNPVEVAPAPKFPDIISIRPKRPPTSIWETSPDGGPRRGSRKPPYRIPYAPDKNVDLRTDWEAWIDSFKEGWKAK